MVEICETYTRYAANFHRIAAVRDAEIRPKPHSTIGRTYRPDCLHVWYGQSGPGEPWEVDKITIGGFDLRNDGNLSKNRTEEKFYSFGGSGDKVPSWAAEWARLNLPEF